MELYKQIAQFYDLLYSYKDYDREVSFLMSHCRQRENPAILDVACGTGNHLRVLRDRMPRARLTGLDLNQRMLDQAISKGINAQFFCGNMQDFSIRQRFDLVYSLSSSMQYNLSDADLKRTIENLARHTLAGGRIILDFAFCKERWKEGYTNITANVNEDYEVAELYTSHSKDGISLWNPIYLIKDRKTGKLDMFVDRQKIRIYSLPEVERILKDLSLDYKIVQGFSKPRKKEDIPLVVIHC